MLLKKLTQTYGISGYESKVADLIIEVVKEHCDSLMKDAMGNVIALKKGNGSNKKKIMVAAHMDEIGFCVVNITSDGFLKVKKMGGISAHISYMSRVQFTNGTQGVIASTDKIDAIKGGDIDKLYIDIGATSKEDALQYINIGDIAGYIGEYAELLNDNIISKSFDDRSGCYMMIESLKELKTPYHDVYFVFTVQEEVGLIGATTASERIQPDLGIALDITGSFDVPNDMHGNATLGKGAAIKVSDAGVICDSDIVNNMIACAKKHNISYQLDVLTNGGTDVGAINKSFRGVKCCGISIPTRYGHSPHSIINKKDLQSCIDLLTQFVSQEIEIVTEIIYK